MNLLCPGSKVQSAKFHFGEFSPCLVFHDPFRTPEQVSRNLAMVPAHAAAVGIPVWR